MNKCRICRKECHDNFLTHIECLVDRFKDIEMSFKPVRKVKIITRKKYRHFEPIKAYNLPDISKLGTYIHSWDNCRANPVRVRHPSFFAGAKITKEDRAPTKL